jgi:hypothetical protein
MGTGTTRGNKIGQTLMLFPTFRGSTGFRCRFTRVLCVVRDTKEQKWQDLKSWSRSKNNETFYQMKEGVENGIRRQRIWFMNDHEWISIFGEAF